MNTMTGKNVKEAVTVSWRGGLRLAVEARGHRVESDQPEEEGGEDRGMTPTELFAGSLGACMVYFAARFFERHRISPPGFSVSVEWDYAEKPHRIGSIEARLDCPGLEPAMEERLLRVMEGCTVHRTLLNPPKIDILLKNDR